METLYSVTNSLINILDIYKQHYGTTRSNNGGKIIY